MDSFSLARCLLQRRVVLIGDSTVRFEYLTLAFLAHFGVLPTEVINAQEASLPSSCVHLYGSVQEGDLALPPKVADSGCLYGPRSLGRNTYLHFTNALLSHKDPPAHEICDCYCPEGGIGVENRLYLPEHDDGYVALITWQGTTRKPHGSFDPSRAFHEHRCAGLGASNLTSSHHCMRSEGWQGPGAPPCPVGQMQPGDADTAWDFQVSELLRTVVKRMRPTHLVVQVGWWPHEYGAKFWSELAAAGIEAVRDHGGRAMFRTTARPKANCGKRGWELCSAKDPDVTPFVRAGWSIHNTSRILEPMRRAAALAATKNSTASAPGSSGSTATSSYGTAPPEDVALFINGGFDIHLTPEADSQLVRGLMDEIGCAGTQTAARAGDHDSGRQAAAGAAATPDLDARIRHADLVCRALLSRPRGHSRTNATEPRH